MNRVLKDTITPLMLTSLLLAASATRAELVATVNSAEANQVRILFTQGKEKGVAQVNQCLTCPLNLEINEGTRFFHDGKEIGRNRVNDLSGRPATVIYSKDGKQALRIRW